MSFSRKNISLPDSIKLNYTYTLWFHSSMDNDWSLESYHQILQFDNIKDFFNIIECLVNRPKMLLNGMFFMMKDDIKPMWEDKENKNGGFISWRVEKENVDSVWENLCALFISESFLELEKYGLNGISISPKKNTNIIKLWIKHKITDDELKSIRLPSECIFKNELRLFKSY
jgi:translation initiation factor 4E